jgi:hypothetical protein
MISGVTVATAAMILSRRQSKSPIFTAQKMFLTYPHMKKSSGVSSALPVGEATDPPLLAHQFGNVAFRVKAEMRRGSVLLESNTSCFFSVSVVKSGENKLF